MPGSSHEVRCDALVRRGRDKRSCADIFGVLHSFMPVWRQQICGILEPFTPCRALVFAIEIRTANRIEPLVHLFDRAQHEIIGGRLQIFARDPGLSVWCRLQGTVRRKNGRDPDRNDVFRATPILVIVRWTEQEGGHKNGHRLLFPRTPSGITAAGSWCGISLHLVKQFAHNFHRKDGALDTLLWQDVRLVDSIFHCGKIRVDQGIPPIGSPRLGGRYAHDTARPRAVSAAIFCEFTLFSLFFSPVCITY